MLNTASVEGSRQIVNLNYGICVLPVSGSCSITYSRVSSDPYSFTITGDVGAVEASLLGTSLLQDQNCTTDYVIISNPSQTGSPLASGIDRFCGLGLTPTTSKSQCVLLFTYLKFNGNLILFVKENFLILFCVGNVKPFVLYVVTDADEALDIGNRGFALAYAQNLCPVISK